MGSNSWHPNADGEYVADGLTETERERDALAERVERYEALVREMADPNIDVPAYRKAWRALVALVEGDE